MRVRIAVLLGGAFLPVAVSRGSAAIADGSETTATAVSMTNGTAAITPEAVGTPDLAAQAEGTEQSAALDAVCSTLPMSADLKPRRPDGTGCPRDVVVFQAATAVEP